MDKVTPSQMLRDPYFWDNVLQIGDCWQWRGPKNATGYGRWSRWNASRGGQTVLVHRIAYTLLVGEIPPGLVIDHLCRNTLCLNPDHLDPVTDRVNLLRGESPSAKAARATHCPQGHPLSGDNMRVYSGARVCLTCKKDKDRRGKAAMRERNRIITECTTCGASLRGMRSDARFCGIPCKRNARVKRLGR